MNLEKRHITLKRAIYLASKFPSASRRWLMFQAKTWADMEVKRLRQAIA